MTDLSRTLHEKLAASALFASLAAMPVLAQEGQEARDRPSMKRDPLRILRHDAVVGAAVTNGLEGDRQQTLGRLADLVIDAKSGTIRYAVLETTLDDGEQKVVGWRVLSFDAESSAFTLPMTQEAIEKLPAFDPENPGGPDSARPPEAAAAKSYLLVSEVAASEVLAKDERLGSADALFVEPRSGTTPFLAVSAGDVPGADATSWVIPWHALELVARAEEGAMTLRLDKGKVALEQAPSPSGDGADLDRPEFRSKIYDFYGVDRPGFEPPGDESAPGESDGRRQSDGR